jgi:hypothetical protein
MSKKRLCEKDIRVFTTRVKGNVSIIGFSTSVLYDGG